MTSEISQAITALTTGHVLAHATETCYGLACDLTNPAAVERLFAIKQRPLTQPVSALFASVEAAKEWVEWNDEAQRLADEYLPGPLTLILPIKKEKADLLFPIPMSNSRLVILRSDSGQVRNPTIGIRISSHPFAQALAKAYGKPISTTSANVHGKPNPYSPQEITEQFADQPMKPDLILDNGVLPPTPPSTVMDLTKAGEVYRTGEIGNWGTGE